MRATLFFVRIHRFNDHLPIVTFLTAIAAWWQLAALTIDNIFEAAILAFVNAGTGRLTAHWAIELVLFWEVCWTHRFGTIVKRHGHLLKNGRLSAIIHSDLIWVYCSLISRDNTINSFIFKLIHNI